MKRNIILEMEELEERIAPHFMALGGVAEVAAMTHGPNVVLELPDGTRLDMPAESSDGLHTAWAGPE